MHLSSTSRNLPTHSRPSCITLDSNSPTVLLMKLISFSLEEAMEKQTGKMHFGVKLKEHRIGQSDLFEDLKRGKPSTLREILIECRFCVDPGAIY